MTCVACVAIGLPLVDAVFRASSQRVRALASALYQLPVALPPLVLAFGFILVFSSDALPWRGSVWLLAAGHIVLGLPHFLQAVVADMQRLGLPSGCTGSPTTCPHQARTSLQAPRTIPLQEVQYERCSFDIDMQHCPNCGGGELEIIAAILERPVIDKILTHLGLDPQPPPKAPVRKPGRPRAG